MNKPLEPLVYRFDSIGILRFIAREYPGKIQTHRAWLNRGDWKLPTKKCSEYVQYWSLRNRLVAMHKLIIAP
jgi:hypothetical protein